MVVRPSNVKWELVHYNDFKTPLFTTDYQKIVARDRAVNEIGKSIFYKKFFDTRVLHGAIVAWNFGEALLD